jgi:hypothetical protein
MATPSKKVTNQAQIAQAQAQNAAAQAKIVEAQAKAAAADAARKPVLKQTVAGIGGINKALQASLAALTNPKSSQAQIDKALAESKKALAANKANLATITPEQRQMAVEQGQIYTSAMSDVEKYNAMMVNVPGAIYEDEKQKSANVAYDTIGKILESYRITGLASVLETIRDEYPEASSEDILTLLQFDSRYNAKFNERFAANADRLKAGKPVLSPSEYLKLEQGYMKVFNAYNLPTFNTQYYYDTFIRGDLDVDEVTDRVQLGYDRVLNDQAVQSTFNKFFSSLGFNDIVAGMLDPVNQLPALERKVKAAEIGGAALRQGLVPSELAATEAQANVPYTNVTRGTVGADVLGREGITKAQAEAGYKNIAQLLPTAEKLSSIYGGTEEQYGRLEAEQEQLQGLASAARKRQRLTELETAQFRKQSGLGRGALSSITNV